MQKIRIILHIVMMFVRTLAIGALALACFIAGVWSVSNSLTLPWFFLAYAAMLWLVPATVYTLLGRYQSALLQERLRPPSDRDRKTRFVSMGIVVFTLTLTAVEFALAERSRANTWYVIGFVLCITGFALVGWTLLSNPYASSAVRIQTERDHRVITSGPYAFVRHPMYLGVLFFTCGTPLALGSWWSLGPLFILLLLFARRTLVEDAMLQAQLDGYREYASKIRWKVVPLLF